MTERSIVPLQAWAVGAQTVLDRLIQWEAEMADGTKMSGDRKDALDGMIVMAKELTEQMTEQKTREAKLQEMRADLREEADRLRSEGYGQRANTLLNIEQSLASPESYRRLP